MPSNQNNNLDYGEMVDKNAQMARWQMDLQGLYAEDYRKPLSYPEQQRVVDAMGNFLEEAAKEEGKTVGDFRADVNVKVKEEGERAKEYDEIHFHKLAEEDLTADRRKNRDKVSGYGFIRRFLAKLVPFGKRKIQIKGYDKESRFQENQKGIMELTKQVDVVNTAIGVLKDRVSKLEIKLDEYKGTDVEPQIRRAITDHQNAISDKIKKLMVYKTSIQHVRGENNEVLEEIRKLLDKYGRKLQQKYGGKVNRLIQERQALIEQLNKSRPASREHFDKRQDIAAKIEKNELQLEKLRQKIIKYKSKYWFFYFEDMLGVQSIPQIHGYWQISSLDVERYKTLGGQPN